MGRLMRMAILLAGLAAASGSAAWADTLDDIKERGTIVVGVKADYPPWGMRDADGNIVGMEIDLAREIADRLGVELELMPVVASNRMQFLQQGKIDLILATMNDKPERRKVVGIVDPNYYASGVNVFARKSVGLEKWEDLEGLPVCAVQGSWFNKMVAERYGAEVIAFKGVPEVEQAVLAGRCAAWLYDDIAFVTRIQDKKKWGDFEMPLETIGIEPWSIAVPLGEENGPYGKLISDMITDWHRTGHILELARKWDIPPPQWLKEMHEKYKNP
jgi:polar amino acid transport system substrate-binding protein